MRELAILTFVTLDGVMQAPAQPEEDTSGGFKSGGWARSYWDEVMQQVGEEAMAAPYDMLFGRKTYKTFAKHFSEGGDGNSESGFMTKARKYVATSRPEDLTWENSIAIGQDLAAEISALKQQDGPLLQVHGSWQLIQSLLDHDSIDEFRLWIFPVVIGSGKRLFGKTSAINKLTLVKSRTTSNGVVMGIYRSVNSQ